MIMNKTTILALASIAAMSLRAETFEIDSFGYYGPYAIQAPLMVDSVNVKGQKIDSDDLSPAPGHISLSGPHTVFSSGKAPSADGNAVHILTFDIENTTYTEPVLTVEGIDGFSFYVDGRKTDPSDITLRPATHRMAIRYVTTPETETDSLKVTLESGKDAGFSMRKDRKRRYTLLDVLHGTSVTGTSISPDGKYAITTYVDTRRGGDVTRRYRLTRLSDGQTIAESSRFISWMPSGASYFYFDEGTEGRRVTSVDVATGERHVISDALPEDAGVAVSPDGSFLLLSSSEEGRKEDLKVYEILEPEDRQPGWRERASLSILDLRTGITRPLTFGNRNVYCQDISDDSRKLLISTTRSRLEKRPTTVTSVYVLDLATMKADTIVSDDGFISRAMFSPDATKVLVTGSPEALGGVGSNVPEGRIPSMTDNQLFMIDLATRHVTPLTKDFNPSVAKAEWSRADGRIYLTAEDRDRVNLFRLDPATGAIARIDLPEETVTGFSLPDKGTAMMWYGESASKPRSLYMLDTKSLRSRLLDTPKREMLADVGLGRCEAWDFVSSRGDTINGRFYLPPDFDPAKKYPLIVNYYGGCSPTGRNFESRYPHNAYAAQGYVVYVINPSGATGFGQEFSSRHVNTAGEGVAQDIIEGTKKFCEEHPYVDSGKIGCIGASYGGFMTQYLQTVTDIFAAAISHAGISDHTSYWGEGYWGYSYSEVSMAGSYPWTNPDLYMKQSPLYNADKIHTPLLFLHGDKDNNVPVGESIQMFTALKLLGRPTAFVAVADQDHHIMEYDKRIKWQDTIFAWFARYLKDDPTWWDALYPPTPL